MREIFEIAGAILVSLGGAGVVLFGLSSWLGKIWAERIIKKDQLKNDNILYASQIQFEREYKIYSELWLSMLNLKWDTLSLMPILDFLPEEKEEERKLYFDRYERHISSAKEFNKMLYSNAPFICGDIYVKLLEISKLCREQGIAFSIYKLEMEDDVRNHKERKEYYDKDKMINEKTDEVTEQLRDYLKKYRVV
jgi:hypothetical protein